VQRTIENCRTLLFASGGGVLKYTPGERVAAVPAIVDAENNDPVGAETKVVSAPPSLALRASRAVGISGKERFKRVKTHKI
jgi:hypothetical protein